MENREWRASVVLPAEIEDAILNLRNRDEFKRASLSELLRLLLVAGLKAYGYNGDEPSDKPTDE